ncbi:glycosyltransferase family 2 protein [uncultured Methylibium sp.]|uniref:glycosyltransferase family 2 protein n=1 Tax=uncultured Methylibium sp. TaxID=381093 RepID=UPI0025F830ED|nr:glycosyltransferase family 2 protein [uncultured Methylibium sp.]
MAGPAPVLVVIVNYRTGGLVVKSLRSLAVEVRDCPGTQVLVVDNCSDDDSADVIAAAIAAEGWSGWARLHRAPVNGGFSYGNNCGIRPAMASGSPPHAFWLLNPDTEVRPGALRVLVDFLDAHPRAGIAGSSFEEADGKLWPHAFRFPSIWSELASGLRLGFVGALLKKHTVLMRMGDDVERVDWLPGSSMLVRADVFRQVGLMDEGYFLYFEETDFCLRAAQAGWECWYVPQSRVMHIAGQSTGVTGEQAMQNRRPDYWFESRRRYWIKHHGWPYAAATDLVWMAAFVVWRIRAAIQRKPAASPPHYLRDFLRHSALFHTTMPSNARLQGIG